MEERIVLFGVVFSVLLLAFVFDRTVLVWRRRRRQWRKVAPTFGLVYAGDDPAIIEAYGTFRLFKRGQRKRVHNAMTGGLAGIELTLADYQYSTGADISAALYAQTAAILRCPGMNVPQFLLRRRRVLLDFLGHHLGRQDIDLPEDGEFSARWILQGENEAAVRRLFDHDVRHALGRLTSARANLEGRGDTLVYHEGRLIAPARARELLDRATIVLEALRR